jgi:hypothetical protein
LKQERERERERERHVRWLNIIAIAKSTRLAAVISWILM